MVEPGPGAVPICFSGAISGLDALQLAGANPLTYGFAGQGAAVCQLFGVGNPADSSCLIGPGGQYWAYYRAAPGAGGWTYSRGGASSTTVVDGAVEGWRYGTGAAPGFVGFCAVVGCGPPPTEAPPPTAPPATNPPVVARRHRDATRRGDDCHHGRAVVGQGGQGRRWRDRRPDRDDRQGRHHVHDGELGHGHR